MRTFNSAQDAANAIPAAIKEMGLGLFQVEEVPALIAPGAYAVAMYSPNAIECQREAFLGYF